MFNYSYGMRPNLPNRPAFARYGSLRHQHDPSSGDESADDNNKAATDTDDGASDKLSVSFSEVDETDSINEVSSVKEKTIEEEDEVDSRDVTPHATPVKPVTMATKPPLPPEQRLGPISRLSSNNIKPTPVFQKTPSSETVKCNVVLKPPGVSDTITPAPTPTVVTKHNKVPIVPAGFVGFASLPDQVYRKSLRKGFEFSLMVVGESGLGKSTLVNSMFLTDIYTSREAELCPTAEKTVKVETHHVVLEEGGVKLSLNVVDTPGFGDGVDNTNCWDPIIEYVDQQFNLFLEAETRVNRVKIADNRVHVCLYFLAPTGHGLRSVDVEFMRRLHDKVVIKLNISTGCPQKMPPFFN